MLLIQIVLVGMLLIATVMTWKRSREQAISYREAILWTLLWSMASVAVILPQTTTILARVFGVGRGVDVILYASVVMLFIALFRLHVSVERLERKLTDLVRMEALKKVEEKK
jgi:hypothetical protein